MIRLQRITNPGNKFYQYMEKLITESFPPEEYRDLDELRIYTETKEIFHNNLIFNEDTSIGMISYWAFDKFYYIEHFAIDSKQRNGGYGKQVIEHLKEMFRHPIVLEVEKSTEKIAQRRINFYIRQGFVLWDNPYLQPPYRSEETFLPMQLMAQGKINCKEDYPEVKQCIYNNVYGI